VKYACIAEQQRDFDVRLMCRLLGVSRSGYYAAQDRAARGTVSARTRTDQRLRLAIRTVHRTSRGRYGAPRVHAELRDQGLRCGRKRVARLMRADALRGRSRRRGRVTTQSAHPHPVAANVLQRQFAPAAQPGRDRAWAADITYLPTRDGWLYLAVVLDLASRRVVGWCAAPQLDTTLPLRALESALVRRRPAGGLVHHSDRGVQYASAAYQAALARHGAQCSMSRKGDCWDNAVVESFFATLKTELAEEQGPGPWPSRAAAQRTLADYLVWYNTERRHTTLGYRSPLAYERDVLAPRQAA
jgi:transposase InsO family protein